MPTTQFQIIPADSTLYVGATIISAPDHGERSEALARKAAQDLQDRFHALYRAECPAFDVIEVSGDFPAMTVTRRFPAKDA
jgi:hypothetical protein